MPLIPRRRRRPSAMTVIEHLTELRRRLVIIVIAVLLGTILGLIFFEPLFDLFRGPYCDTLERLPNRVLPPQAQTADECVLYFSGIPDAFLLRLKVGLYAGLAVALPVILYELWMFVTPGLTRRERRLALPFVLSSMVLFALGAWFAFSTLPRALNFLLGFGGPSVQSLLFADRYVSFVMLLVLAFGVSFEFPLILIFLTAARVITSQQLRSWRRYAYLGVLVAAAVLTPSQDLYTMLAMAIPLIIFYELSVLLARLFKR